MRRTNQVKVSASVRANDKRFILGCSDRKLGDFFVDAGKARSDRHVHELALGVHLQAADDARVHLVLNREGLALVLGVRLEGSKHLRFLAGVELICGDDGDFLLPIELLVQSLVQIRDLLDIDQTLVLGQHGQEVESDGVEVSRLFQGLV